MIYNKKYIFGFWHRAPKTQNFPGAGQSCIILGGDFWKIPKDAGWLPEKPTMWLEGWNFHYTPLPRWPLEGGEGLEIGSIAKGQWFNQSCLHNEAPPKPQKDRVLRASRLVNMRRVGESGMLIESVTALCPFTHTLPCTSFPYGCSWVIVFYK